MYAAADPAAPAKAVSLPSSPRGAQALRESRDGASLAVDAESQPAEARRRPLSSLKAAVAESRKSAAANDDNVQPDSAPSLAAKPRGSRRHSAAGDGGPSESPKRVVYAFAPGYAAPAEAPGPLPLAAPERRLEPATAPPPFAHAPAAREDLPTRALGAEPLPASDVSDPEMITLERSDFRQLVVALRNLREQRAQDLVALRSIREVCGARSWLSPSRLPPDAASAHPSPASSFLHARRICAHNSEPPFESLAMRAHFYIRVLGPSLGVRAVVEARLCGCDA